MRSGVLLACLLVIAELVLRFQYGFGDPPLFIPHPAIEYLQKPSSSYHRFGNTIAFNSYSMRSGEFPAGKSDPGELRIMVMGDSIINGGAWTDQADIATEVLRRNLQKRYPDRHVVVGNISATSWGPANMLAYVKTFGLFDADAVIIVLASEDYADAPTFAALNYEKPTRKPLLALQEVVVRYTPALINYLRKGSGPTLGYEPPKEDIDSSMQALRELFDEVQSRDIPLAVLYHLERDELVRNMPKAGYVPLRQLMANRRVPIIDIGFDFATEINAEREPYRDWVHPNANGQRVMAELMEKWLVTQFKR